MKLIASQLLLNAFRGDHATVFRSELMISQWEARKMEKTK